MTTETDKLTEPREVTIGTRTGQVSKWQTRNISAMYLRQLSVNDIYTIAKEGIEVGKAIIDEVVLERCERAEESPLVCVCFDFVGDDEYGCGQVEYKDFQKLNSLMEDLGVNTTHQMKGRYVSVLKTKGMPSTLLGLSAYVDLAYDFNRD